MAENRKKKNQRKLLWWLTPVLLLAVLAIRFGGEALGRGFQWLSDSQTSESTTTAQKVPSDETLTVRFLDVDRETVSCSPAERTRCSLMAGRSRRGSFWCPV